MRYTAYKVPIKFYYFAKWFIYVYIYMRDKGSRDVSVIETGLLFAFDNAESSFAWACEGIRVAERGLLNQTRVHTTRLTFSYQSFRTTACANFKTRCKRSRWRRNPIKISYRAFRDYTRNFYHSPPSWSYRYGYRQS